MKKFIFVLTLFAGLMFSSCNKCTNTPQQNLTDSVKVAELVVENTVSTDRQAMYLKVGEDYRWYETCILLPYYLDSDSVTSTPAMVSNIFQSIVAKGNGYDTWVYKFQHFPDGTCLIDSVQGFWIEDSPLNDNEINLKYTEAFDKVMQTNSPKPHSRQVCLREPVGPLPVNAQYVFGNIREQLWVDAVNGNVVNSCPAFPIDIEGFKMPLGEWP